MLKHLQDERGLGAFDIILAVLFIAALGITGYFTYKLHTAKPDATTTPSPSVKATSTPTPTPTPKSVTVTPAGGWPLQADLPIDWSFQINDPSVLSGIIRGQPFVMSFEVTQTDYLKQPAYGGDDTLLKQVQASGGTTIYVLKSITHGSVFLSSCAPTNGYGCSLTQNAHPLFVELSAPATSGTATTSKLNFDSATTTTAISDFETMAQSLRI